MKHALGRMSIAVCALLSVGACHHHRNDVRPNPPQAQQIPPNPGVACINTLVSDPSLAIIARKVALAKVDDQNFEMLSSTSKPTVKEKAAIAKWVDGKQNCRKEIVAWRAQYFRPTVIWTIEDEAFSAFLGLTADLYNRKLTYGAYAKARAARHAEAMQKWAEARQHVEEQQAAAENEQRNREAMAEQQRRNRAMQYMLNQQQIQANRPQPYQMPVTQPTYTNCSVVGNQMYCTTR